MSLSTSNSGRTSVRTPVIEHLLLLGHKILLDILEFGLIRSQLGLRLLKGLHQLGVALRRHLHQQLKKGSPKQRGSGRKALVKKPALSRFTTGKFDFPPKCAGAHARRLLVEDSKVFVGAHVGLKCMQPGAEGVDSGAEGVDSLELRYLVTQSHGVLNLGA
eukprot:255023-Prorocentrum_minimum.AAC.1